MSTRLKGNIFEVTLHFYRGCPLHSIQTIDFFLWFALAHLKQGNPFYFLNQKLPSLLRVHLEDPLFSSSDPYYLQRSPPEHLKLFNCLSSDDTDPRPFNNEFDQYADCA